MIVTIKNIYGDQLRAHRVCLSNNFIKVLITKENNTKFSDKILVKQTSDFMFNIEYKNINSIGNSSSLISFSQIPTHKVGEKVLSPTHVVVDTQNDMKQIAILIKYLRADGDKVSVDAPVATTTIAKDRKKEYEFKMDNNLLFNISLKGAEAVNAGKGL